MILIALAGLCALSVPVTGGHLGRLAELRLRGLWLPVLALAVQVMITTIMPGGNRMLHDVLHVVTYVLLAGFLWANCRLPGVPLVGAGAGMNWLAITLNGGVMPAAATAQRLAGLHPGAGFHNSAHLAHPALPWLGDIIPWPGPLPNVLSVGDCLIYAGTAVLLHRVCHRRAQNASISMSTVPTRSNPSRARIGADIRPACVSSAGVPADTACAQRAAITAR